MNSFATGLRILVGQHAHQLPTEQLLTMAAALCNGEVRSEDSVPYGTRPQVDLPRFSNDGHDNMTDRQTGLMWSWTLEVGKVDFKGAEGAVTNLEIAGLKGWRLPTIQELLTLVDYGRHDPAIDAIFECKSDWYWSSTPAAYSPADFAWIVGFYNGDARWYHRDRLAFVRAVRPSQ